MWNWNEKRHILLSECSKNLNYKKYCLNTKAKREFIPEEGYEYPITNAKRFRKNDKENIQ